MVVDRCLISVVAFCAVVAFGMPAALSAEVPNPVTGPVAAAGIPGNPAHNYPFFATNHDLATRIRGRGVLHPGHGESVQHPAQATGTIIDSDHPYKTRIVVRRRVLRLGRCANVSH